MTEQTIEGSLAGILQNVAKPMVVTLTLIIPPLFKIMGKTYAFYKTLPENVIKFLIGFIFCFFGGVYPTVFAAAQAAEHGGRKAVIDAVGDLAEEAMKIIEASKKDDEEDKDKVRTCNPGFIQYSRKSYAHDPNIILHISSFYTTGWKSRCFADRREGVCDSQDEIGSR